MFTVRTQSFTEEMPLQAHEEAAASRWADLPGGLMAPDSWAVGIQTWLSLYHPRRTSQSHKQPTFTWHILWALPQAIRKNNQSMPDWVVPRLAWTPSCFGWYCKPRKAFWRGWRGWNLGRQEMEREYLGPRGNPAQYRLGPVLTELILLSSGTICMLYLFGSHKTKPGWHLQVQRFVSGGRKNSLTLRHGNR